MLNYFCIYLFKATYSFQGIDSIVSSHMPTYVYVCVCLIIASYFIKVQC